MAPQMDIAAQRELGFRVREAVQMLVSIDETERGHEITVPCLYPSGQWAQVTVTMRDETFRVSDGGRGMAEIRMMGIIHHRPGIFLARAGRSHSVSYRAGVLLIDDIEQSFLSDAIALVASASVEGVVRAVESYRFPNARNFRFAFDSFIAQQFPNKFRKEELVGLTKRHPFDFVHRGGRLIVVDPLQRSELSINRAFTAHSDLISATQRPDAQIIVYDPDDDWGQSDIRLLKRSGADVMTFAKIEHDLPGLMQAA